MPDLNPAETIGLKSPLLSVRELAFAYQSKNSESGFSISVKELDIYPHNRLAIIGPNGAGKTTLLQLISLLLQPRQGIISFNGVGLITKKQVLDYHRATAFVPQKNILYNCSVRDNVALGLSLRKESPSDIDAKITEILKTLKIEHLANKSALKISGGEARRTMLARALVLKPKILFLDEPFSDLDEPIRRELIEDLLPLISQTGCATIFVTHNQDETYQLADRFMIMLKGSIVQQSNAHEVFANPATQEVAAFIGIKNIIPSKVIGFDKDIISISLETGKKEALKIVVSGSKPKSENVIVCIPPESIVISAPQSPEMHTSSRNVIPGIIKRIIPSRYFAWVEVDCGTILTASITHESILEMGLSPGRPVRLLIKSTAIKILPGA